MDTQELIASLAHRTNPVSHLWSPWQRTLAWFALSLTFAVPVMAFHLVDAEARGPFDLRLAIEETAILLTALCAAVAAFSSVVPGRDWRTRLLPLPPLIAWLASLGESCVRDWHSIGGGALQLRSDWDCAIAAIVLGIVPGTAMLAMLRRGAPLAPRTTLLLGALAVAAAVNAALRVFHTADVSVMVLVWHFGGAILLSAAVAPLGGLAMNWRRLRNATVPLPR